MTVQESITKFYEDHDFGEDGGVNDKVAYLKVGPFSIPIPNTKERRELIYLHDLDHIVNQYDTSWQGESMVSTWEFITGGWGFRPVIWLMISSVMSVGMLLYPRRIFQAFIRGQYTRGILSLNLSKEKLMNLPIAELKRQLGFHDEIQYPVTFTQRLTFAGLCAITLFSWLAFMLGLSWCIRLAF